MKKQHEKWLQAFLENCRQTNKSEHTLINYRADILKYIHWYEQRFNNQLNKATATTIGEYKQFLSEGTWKKELATSLEKPKKRPSIKKGLGKIGHFFSHIFRPKNKRPRKEKKVDLEQEPLSVSSRRRHLSSIKNFYEYLKQSHEDVNKMFRTNPVKSKLHAIKLKEEDVLSTKLLTKDHWKKILECTYRPQERLIIHLLYFGGLRLAELTELKVSNFNTQERTLTFRRKGGYIHQLAIRNSRKIFKILDDHLATRKVMSDFLFARKNSRPITSRTMYNYILDIFKRAGVGQIGLGPHSFRKACATNLYKETKDLLFVRDYLNHSDAKVTQTYIEKSRPAEPVKKINKKKEELTFLKPKDLEL